MKHKILRWIRRASQVFFLFLFFYLFLKTGFFGSDKVSPWLSFFFRSDLYAVGISTVASKTLATLSFFFLVTAASTLILGRFFCGWICPLGTLNALFSWLFKAKKRKFKKPPLKYKYLLLLILFVAALYGMGLGTILDPLAILFRATAIAIHPGANFIAEELSRFIPDLSSYTLVEPHLFYGALSAGLLLLIILLLNLVEERFWCRYICPYGALLSLLSKKNLLRLRIDPEKCTKCGICDAVCPASATPFLGWKPGECYQCFRCHDMCPEAAISSTFSTEKNPKPQPVNLKRREALLAAASSLLALPLVRAEKKVLRPPGASSDFTSRCIRCGECVKGCPTGVLQPMGLVYGLENYSTPRLATELSYCEYDCLLCQYLCPTGAIGPFTPETKKMGVARVDRSICLPFAYGQECIVCEEHCPVPTKAIKLIDVETINPQGKRVKTKAPVVVDDLCIGCGICENKCPQSPKAIRVYPR